VYMAHLGVVLATHLRAKMRGFHLPTLLTKTALTHALLLQMPSK
jgi:hypothetical protein